MHQALIKVISSIVPLAESDKILWGNHFYEQKIRRNTIIDEQAKIPQTLHFIIKGYMRLFYHDVNGDEVTTLITSPGSFIASFLSLAHQEKATESVACITDCEIISIDRQDVFKLIEKSEPFKKLTLTIFEQAMAVMQRRANDLATLSAEERYKKLLLEQPDIVQYVPIQFIASYLGIKSQSLSRIRRHFL